jgi:hypothetical protein
MGMPFGDSPESDLDVINSAVMRAFASQVAGTGFAVYEVIGHISRVY